MQKRPLRGLFCIRLKPQRKAASPTRVNSLHAEAVKPTKLAWEAEPRVHFRYYPEVWHESVPWTLSPKRLSPKNTYPLKEAPR